MKTISAPISKHEKISPESKKMVTCYYVNRSPWLEILRISNVDLWYFEKIVFPHQRLTFDAPHEGLVEIYTSESGDPALADRLSCEQLKITP